VKGKINKDLLFIYWSCGKSLELEPRTCVAQRSSGKIAVPTWEYRVLLRLLPYIVLVFEALFPCCGGGLMRLLRIGVAFHVESWL